MRGHARSAAAAALAIALFTAGCASDRVNGLRPANGSVAPQALAPVAPAAGACAFAIESVNDLREHKSLGTVAGTHVDGDHFAQWFADGLKATPGYRPQGTAVVLKVDILRAYIQSLATMKSVNVVVRVQTSLSGGAPRTKLYRGVDNSTNWASSENEVQVAFDGAMSHLREQVANDLAAGCPAATRT